MQVEKRQHRGHLRASPTPRQAGSSFEKRLALAGLLLDAAVVHPWRLDLKRARRRSSTTRASACPLRTTRRWPRSSSSLSVLGDVGIDLGLEGDGEHAPGALRDRSRRSRTRPPRPRPLQRLLSTLAFLPRRRSTAGSRRVLLQRGRYAALPLRWRIHRFWLYLRRQLVELKGSGTVARDDFGSSVAIPGNLAIVGASGRLPTHEPRSIADLAPPGWQLVRG